eukprot:3252445-Rhodomonas_salina.1
MLQRCATWLSTLRSWCATLCSEQIIRGFLASGRGLQALYLFEKERERRNTKRQTREERRRGRGCTERKESRWRWAWRTKTTQTKNTAEADSSRRYVGTGHRTGRHPHRHTRATHTCDTHVRHIRVHPSDASTCTRTCARAHLERTRGVRTWRQATAALPASARSPVPRAPSLFSASISLLPSRPTFLAADAAFCCAAAESDMLTVT